MLSFIQQIKTIVYIQAILPTVAYISNKSGAIGVQHCSPPFPHLHLSTRTHINKLMLHRDTYKNHFQVEKTPRCSGRGLSPDLSPPLGRGSGGGSAGPGIAYPPDHLGGLAPTTANTDSSNRISNDCEVASEKFRGYCTRI